MLTTSIYLSLVASVAFLLYLRSSRRRARLPPGPIGLPIVGNYFNIPANEPWLEYERWASEKGWDIVHLDVMGKDVLVVNSPQVASDLFDKKAAIYSDRPQMTMVNDVLNLGWHLGFMPRNEQWKGHRQLFTREHNSSNVPRLRPIHMKWTQQFLRNMLASPERLFGHLQHMACGTALEDTYGLEVQPSGQPDPFLSAAIEAITGLGATGIFGTYLVDYIPLSKYIPSFLSGYKKQANEWRKSVDIAWAVPFDLVKKAVDDGTAVDSVCSSLLRNMSPLENSKDRELLIRQSCAAMFASGFAATPSVMGTFFLAMIQFPKVQAKAQAEIDSVLEGTRLPTWEDMESMPYINALIKEVLRWNPAVPLAFPHRLEEDDAYNGYYLPAGSIVVPNTWAILRDPMIYPNPERFEPARFLNAEGQLDPTVKSPNVAFGYGRRTCPGKASAMSTLTLAISSTLAAFNITKAVDKNGKPITPSGEYTDGLIRFPLPFKCNVLPRSAKAKALIEATA